MREAEKITAIAPRQLVDEFERLQRAIVQRSQGVRTASQQTTRAMLEPHEAEQIAAILDSLPLHSRQILARALAGGLQIRLPRKARLDSRDDEIRRTLAQFYSARPPSAAAKDFAREFDQYLSTGWLREMDLERLPLDASAKRSAFHRIARLSEGRSLAWRQVVNIADGDRGR
jgi:hypothetical protein